MKVYKFPFSIAYADTDASGIVYHGRYIEIAERARMDILRGITFPNSDIGFVVNQLIVKYKHPLRLADDILVETVVTKFGMVSLDVEQKFVKDDEICAIINVKIAYIGADLRPKRIPDSVVCAFTNHIQE